MVRAGEYVKGTTLLHIAARYGLTNTAQSLVIQQVDIHAGDAFGRIPLRFTKPVAKVVNIDAKDAQDKAPLFNLFQTLHQDMNIWENIM